MRVGGEGEWAPKPPARREGWEGVEGLRIRRKRPGEAPPSRCLGSDPSARPKGAPRAPKPGYGEGYEVPGVERRPEGWGAGPEGEHCGAGRNNAEGAVGEV
jgi:hypothetical protein